MKEIIKFLTSNPIFYLATIEGGKPRVRPFGFVMEYEGRIYFCTNNTKNVFKQLKENPNFEVCTVSANREWIRLKGKAVFDGNLAAKAAALKAAPFLTNLYKTPDNPIFEVFYVQDGEATINAITGESRSITF